MFVHVRCSLGPVAVSYGQKIEYVLEAIHLNSCQTGNVVPALALTDLQSVQIYVCEM